MSAFVQNFDYIYQQTNCRNDNEFAGEVGLSRSTVNRLKNGKRPLSKQQAILIARYAGVEVADLYLPHAEFVEIYNSRKIVSDYMIHSLRVVEKNLRHCRDLFPTYSGQYVVYTNKSKDGRVIASLLELTRVTKHGIEFHMINPYLEVPGKYESYNYKGYMMPVENFLYFVGEQEKNEYEILTMIFETSGAPKVGILRGLWTGIGVKGGVKAIASVPAIAVKRSNIIENWRNVTDKNVGYLKVANLPHMIQEKLRDEIIRV